MNISNNLLRKICHIKREGAKNATVFTLRNGFEKGTMECQSKIRCMNMRIPSFVQVDIDREKNEKYSIYFHVEHAKYNWFIAYVMSVLSKVLSKMIFLTFLAKMLQNKEND